MSLVNEQLVKSDRAVVASGTPTNIYIVETPRGTLKIGRAVNIADRLKDLHREFGGPVRLIASFAGTQFDESDIHVRFNEYRLTDRLGEQFEDVPEIRDFVDTVGISLEGEQAIWAYSRYRPTGTARQNLDWAA